MDRAMEKKEPIGFDLEEGSVIFTGEEFIVAKDKYPVTEGHTLIIAKRKDARDYFDLNYHEIKILHEYIRMVTEMIEDASASDIDGYNIGMNCGEAAGQTVMQFHLHIIPRRKGDWPHPQGGVRKSVNGEGNWMKPKEAKTKKMAYEEWCAKNEEEILIELAETGADREMDFNSEVEFENRYEDYLNQNKDDE